MGSEQNEGTGFPPSEPKLCANGCGFFGTPSNMNLCSKCYRDLRAKEEQAEKAKAAMKRSLGVEAMKKETSTPVTEPSQPVADVAIENKPAEPNRCLSCRKKVRLGGFKCRCGSIFCGEHRYPEAHECSFDFKSAGRDAIAKANPVVKADKLERF